MTERIMLSSAVLAMSLVAAAQIPQPKADERAKDTTDVFYRHLQLNEIVVTGITGQTKLKHASSAITLLSPRELRSAAAVNPVDVVAHQPGIAQVTTGSSISKPIIRGLGYNRVVVMNDGVRQEGQQWGDEHGLEVDARSIHSVEVLKGPASLMYGSDAMAGVLILHDSPVPAEGEVKGEAATEYHTNNGLFGASLNLAGNQKGFFWDGRYTERLAHAYKTPYDGYVPGSQFRERDGRLKLGLNKQWGSSHLTGSIVHQRPGIIEGERDSLTGALESEGWHDKSYAKVLPFQHVRHYKAVSENSFNLPLGWLKAVIGYQQNRRQEYEEAADECELDFKLHTVTYDFRYLTPEIAGCKLSAGLAGMYQQSLNLAEETLIPAYKLFDIGTFATASKSWKKLSANAGVRYDYRHLDFHSRRFQAVTGSVGAVWNASERINLRLNAARGFRAPNMSELGSDGVHEGTLRYEIGNERMAPEHSSQLDVGMDFSSHYFSFQVALFANFIDNYIFASRLYDVVRPDGLLTYRYRQGDARLLGFEAGVDFHPIHSVHFANTFSYVDARQLHQPVATRYLPLTPAPRWTSELKYELTHHGHIFNNSYVAAGLELNARQNHFYRADETETATPRYTLFNLSAGTDLLVKRRKVAEVYLICDNLFDKGYQNHLSRLKYAAENVVTGRRGVFNMGRNVVMKVVVPFTLRRADL